MKKSPCDKLRFYWVDTDFAILYVVRVHILVNEDTLFNAESISSLFDLTDLPSDPAC